MGTARYAKIGVKYVIAGIPAAVILSILQTLATGYVYTVVGAEYISNPGILQLGAVAFILFVLLTNLIVLGFGANKIWGWD